MPVDRRFGIIMGSQSDWESVMQYCVSTFGELGVICRARVMSAHRTPDLVRDYACCAADSGIQVIIAAAGGGAAHLAGFVKAYTQLPVIGIPVNAESLMSVVGMPGGRPVLTMAVGKAGAINAALAAAEIAALNDRSLALALKKYRHEQTMAVSRELFGNT